MTWHHIVVSTDNTDGKSYRIAEYYKDLNAWTENPIAPYEESVDNLIWSLEKMLEAAKAAKESPELILDETAWEKQIKQAVDEADAGEFATQEKVEEIRNKYLDNN